jgi:serine/threonine protein phosphatase 1
MTAGHRLTRLWVHNKMNRPERTSIFARTRTAEGLRIYAIGDIHGMLELATKIFNKIDEECARFDGDVIIVGLGDYIDRGPNSKAVLEYLLQRSRMQKCRLVALRGNHEDLLLRFLDEPEVFGQDWLQLGGEATLASYGVALSGRRQKYAALRKDLVSCLPVEHLAFLQSLPLTFEHLSLFFSHAGARPGIALFNQAERDLLWTRWRESDDALLFEKILIHGHTPVVEPVAAGGRINVDTGAYATGRLSAVRISSDGYDFLTATVQQHGK